MAKKYIGAIILVVIVVGALIGASVLRRPSAPPKTIDEHQQDNGFPVTVEQLSLGNIDQYVDLTGKISALDKQVITSKVGGKVASVSAREGDRVRAGQVLVVLEQQDYRNALKQAELSLKQAKANLDRGIADKKTTVINNDVSVKNARASVKQAEQALELAKKPYRNQEIIQAEDRVASAKLQLQKSKADADRYASLYQKGAVSKSDYENMKLAADLAEKTLNSANEALSLLQEQGRSESIAQAEQALEMARQTLRSAEANAKAIVMKDEDIKVLQSNVDIARTSVDNAKYNLANTTIVSKIDGILSTRTVEPGQTIGAGSSLGEIVSDSQQFYLADVSEVDIHKVKVNQPVDVTMDAVPGKSFKGSVKSIYPVADQSTRMFPVRVVMTNDPQIRSGMFAKGKVWVGQHKDVLLVPNGSLVRADGIVAVFKSTENNTVARKIQVEIVSNNDLYSEVKVLSGELQPGDFCIVNGKDSLSDQSKIYLDK